MASNGMATQESRIKFKPRTTTHEIQPDAPEGEWQARILKGKSKALVTQKGDPRLIMQLKLEKAEDEKNEKFQGAEVSFSVIFFDDDDPERKRACNLMKGRLRGLCEAVDVEYADVYPTDIRDDHPDKVFGFRKLFDALEGKTLHLWTRHNRRAQESGEEVVDTEIAFRAPGAGLVTKAVEGGDEDRPGRNKKAAGKGGRR